MRCIALFTGGLDSLLAVRLVQLQHVEVSAIYFRPPWVRSDEAVQRAAAAINVPLTILDLSEGYPQRLRRPRFGYVGGAATCLDCRIAMLAAVSDLIAAHAADFVVTGEVVGQRVRSSVLDLELVAHHARLNDRLVRPLSAKLLEPTLPERQGWIDRSRLRAWQGKSRRRQERLAAEIGLALVPPRPDCPLLAEPLASRARQLIRAPRPVESWELSLLAISRRFELANSTVLLGRNREENERLADAARRAGASCTVAISPANFFGPTALLIGDIGEANVQRAAALVARYSRDLPPAPRLCVERVGEKREIRWMGAS